MAPRRRLSIAPAAIVSLAALAAGCFGGGTKVGGEPTPHAVVLTLENPDGAVRDLGEYVRAVERLSNGSLHVEVTGSPHAKDLDYDKGTVEDVKSGKADLAKIGIRSFDTLGVNEFQPLLAPLVVDSLELERKVLASSLATRMLAGVSQLGVEGVAVLPGELRHPFGISRRLEATADYVGRTIGARPSRVASATFRSLGASARSYVPGALPRTFDGAELDLSTISGNGYDWPGTSLTTNIALWPRIFAVVANPKALARLTPAQRAALRRAGAAALGPAIGRIRNVEAEAKQIVCRRGQVALVEASPSERAALRTAIRPVYDLIGRSASGQAAIREIEAMRRGIAPDTVRGCSGSESSSTEGQTPLDGVYTVTTTAADLRAAGTPPADVIPENWGKWVFVLDRGRLAFTQEDSEACTWAYATFTVAGHETAWRFLDGGGVGPNQAYNKPGEFFRFRWSRYRDTLTLAPVKGAISPENFRAKPWHLVSPEPSASSFSKRCPPPAEALP